VNEGAVIPRLAQRAEGPLKRLIAFAKAIAPTSRWTVPFARAARLAVERSLAVFAARDDAAFCYPKPFHD